MPRYKIWDKLTPIIMQVPHPGYKDGDPRNAKIIGKQIFTPSEMAELVEPACLIDGFSYIISNSPYNGSTWMECSKTAEVYRRYGAIIPEDATPQQICEAVEAWEDQQAADQAAAAALQAEREAEIHGAQVAACQAQEAQAAAIEFQTLLMM